MILQSQLITNIIANEIYQIGWENLENTDEIYNALKPHLTFDITVTVIENGFLVSYIHPTDENCFVDVSFIFKKMGNQFISEEKLRYVSP